MDVVRRFLVAMLLLAAVSLPAGAQTAFPPRRLQRGVAAIRMQSLLRSPGSAGSTVPAPGARLRWWGLGLESGKGALPDVRLTLAGPLELRLVLGRGNRGLRSSVGLTWQP